MVLNVSGYLDLPHFTEPPITPCKNVSSLGIGPKGPEGVSPEFNRKDPRGILKNCGRDRESTGRHRCRTGRRQQCDEVSVCHVVERGTVMDTTVQTGGERKPHRSTGSNVGDRVFGND